jgi:hypothetical protein
VVVGVAVTVADVELLRLEAGVHVYEVAPDTLIVVLSPKHIVYADDGLIVKLGVGVTLTVIEALFVQPFASVALTV